MHVFIVLLIKGVCDTLRHVLLRKCSLRHAARCRCTKRSARGSFCIALWGCRAITLWMMYDFIVSGTNISMCLRKALELDLLHTRVVSSASPTPTAHMCSFTMSSKFPGGRSRSNRATVTEFVLVDVGVEGVGNSAPIQGTLQVCAGLVHI